MVQNNESYGQGQEQTDDPRASSTALVGVVGVFLLVIIVVWLQAMFNKELQDERLAKQVKPRVASLDEFRARQDAKLRSYGWVDRERGTVFIPIERAMEITVRELSDEREGG